MDDTQLREVVERNKRVEADKAWETCLSRRFFIAAITYVIAALYMNYAGLNNPWLGAFVPAGGYLLSTMSLPFVKNYWLKNIYKKQD